MKSSQYANRMIVIEKGQTLTAAIRRCKANHPKVQRLSNNSVRVINRQKGHAYTITLSQPCPDVILGTCNCAAGLRGTMCYHIAAALACPTLTSNAQLPSTLEADHLERKTSVLVKPSQTEKREFYGKIEI